MFFLSFARLFLVFIDLMPMLFVSVITYLCKQSPNNSLVVRLPSWFFTALSAKIGVPVNPNIWLFRKCFLILLCVSPNCVLWHSSNMKTIRLSCKWVIVFSYLLLPNALFSFWIVVTISFVSSPNCFTSALVLSVPSTLPSEKLLNSFVVWILLKCFIFPIIKTPKDVLVRLYC